MDVDADPKKDVGIARWMDDDGNPNSIPGFPWSKAFAKLSNPKISVLSPKNQSAYKSIGMHYLTHSLTLFESRSLKEHMTVQEPDSPGAQSSNGIFTVRIIRPISLY
jgi:hypothetical protein